MVADSIKEVIFVGLPGPTHNYGGLSVDNVAAMSNRGSRSRPKEAALQALSLVRLLTSLGLEAAILPPQLRPHLPLLRTKFSGEDDAVIKKAAAEDPALLEKACSSSAMWTANAATVTAAADSGDGKLHLTVANLQTNIHRRIEAQDTYRVLAAIFGKVPAAAVHAPLPPDMKDEGAANHMRLCPSHGAKGLNVFVYGTDGGAGDPPTARQALAASQEIARTHEIPTGQILFLKQHPDLIRHGVFHNDVIAVANETVLLAHEKSFTGGREDITRLEKAYLKLHGGKMQSIVIGESELSVEEAVRTYFFNSQIVTTKDGMAIIAPTEVRDLYGGKAARLMEKICGGAITAVHYLDLRQSMRNGGGPACLRLRVPMTETQVAAMRADANVLADAALLDALSQLIGRHYPEELSGQDLADPELYHRCHKALERMASLMRLPVLPL